MDGEALAGFYGVRPGVQNGDPIARVRRLLPSGTNHFLPAGVIGFGRRRGKESVSAGCLAVYEADADVRRLGALIIHIDHTAAGVHVEEVVVNGG